MIHVLYVNTVFGLVWTFLIRRWQRRRRFHTGTRISIRCTVHHSNLIIRIIKHKWVRFTVRLLVFGSVVNYLDTVTSFACAGFSRVVERDIRPQMLLNQLLKAVMSRKVMSGMKCHTWRRACVKVCTFSTITNGLHGKVLFLLPRYITYSTSGLLGFLYILVTGPQGGSTIAGQSKVTYFASDWPR